MLVNKDVQFIRATATLIFFIRRLKAKRLKYSADNIRYTNKNSVRR